MVGNYLLTRVHHSFVIQSIPVLILHVDFMYTKFENKMNLVVRWKNHKSMFPYE